MGDGADNDAGGGAVVWWLCTQATPWKMARLRFRAIGPA